VTAEPQIADLVPHAGSMCLLERVVAWDENGVTAATSTHRNPFHPLARDGRLHAIHLCEYGAQAMAVHGGLVAHSRGGRAQAGLLVTLRDVELRCDFVEALAGELLVEARRIHATPTAWQYEFSVTHSGRRLAQGRAMVSVASGS
jgi:predicted hotdog family 3-hydroxylacyl-ACP dehydratase